MNIKHHELEIPSGNPFVNCKLKRNEYAHILTNVIESYPDGFVMAINNKWGTGKTTFIKMWNQHLKDSEYQTIYFNAWENDFENNALTALMGELNALKTEKTKKQFVAVLKKASKISKHILPTIVKAVAEKYINTETIIDAISDVSKGVADIFENDVEEYSKRKKSIEEFKKELAVFIANTSNLKPLVFIIDELDRCRPNYAVSILEQIKHFFSVPNIVFVLSIDKQQLGNAICGVYGSDKIDSEEYLKRFIDIEYSLPKPNQDLFYKYLFEYFNFDEFFNNPKRQIYSELSRDKESFLNICQILFNDSNVTLRQQERIFSHSRLALKSFSVNNYLLPDLYLFLVYLKTIKSNLYDAINQKALSVEELQEKFFEIIYQNLNENSERQIIWLEAYLLNSYNNYLHYPARNRLLNWDASGVKVCRIKSLIDKSENNNGFINVLDSMTRISNGNLEDLSIEHLLKKINITESFKTE